MHDLAAQIAAAMWEYFQRTSHTEDWLRISEIGVNSARHLCDDALLSWLLNSLGQVHSLIGHSPAPWHAFDSLGQVREARQAWQAALPILAKNNDPRAAELRDRLAGASGT